MTPAPALKPCRELEREVHDHCEWAEREVKAFLEREGMSMRRTPTKETR